MCGIIGAFNFKTNKKPVNEWVVNQLEDQITRGREGFGCIFIDPNKKIKIDRATELTKALLDLRFTEAANIVVHHRYPTSSINKISQTHPIVVNNDSLRYKYLVVHNGIISNSEELRKMHMDELGFIYTTDRKTDKAKEMEFNDSEGLAIELARFVENQTRKIKAIGSVAYIILQVDKTTDKLKNIFWGRNNNPLNILTTKDSLRLSSEGEGKAIKENIMYSCNPDVFKIKKRKCNIQKTEYLKETETKQTTITDIYKDNKIDYSYGYNDCYSKNYWKTDKRSEDSVDMSIEDFRERLNEITDMFVDAITLSANALSLVEKQDIEVPYQTMIKDLGEEIEESIQTINDTIREKVETIKDEENYYNQKYATNQPTKISNKRDDYETSIGFHTGGDNRAGTVEKGGMV
jgi:glucosamine 6-phosphate synthetase-like amidotransferase/phosphosugar isomerase protein